MSGRALTIRLSVWWADGWGRGWTGACAGQRDILIYDKWLLVKLSLCAKYVIIISGQVHRECFSDTIRSQFEVLLKPFSSALSQTQNHTDKKTDKQTDKHIHRESRRTK